MQTPFIYLSEEIYCEESKFLREVMLAKKNKTNTLHI